MMAYRSFSLKLHDGVTIAFQRWGSGHAKRVFCIHGWLDNSNSFSELGPFLAEKGYEVTACDLLGHGLSSHAHGAQIFTDYIQNTREILQELGLLRANLIGHSMGTAVSLMYAGAYPESVASIVCLDGFGPTTRVPEDAAKTLR
jgi:pimeloyl-ACP methyl ester carboxylesterase